MNNIDISVNSVIIDIINETEQSIELKDTDLTSNSVTLSDSDKFNISVLLSFVIDYQFLLADNSDTDGLYRLLYKLL